MATANRGVKQRLGEYRRKRDFKKTAEPSGSAPTSHRGALRFVIQKHSASHLHYDFRLELKGVMKSWAVPKGPSVNPSVKRLAMEVEDHPIEYNTFEGTIPQGEYGGGTVMLWDRGTYTAEGDFAGNEEESLRRGYEQGTLKITLHGERLQGSWALVRMTRPGRPQWLLIKHEDEYASHTREPTESQLTSVATGRTMEEIGTGGAAKKSTRTRRAADSGAGTKSGATRVRANPVEQGSERNAIGRAASRARKSLPAAPRARRAASNSGTLDDPLVKQLEAIEESESGTISLPGAGLAVTHLSKVVFPADKLTKGDVMRHYARVASFILPTLKDRPLVMRRYPSGISGPSFFQQKPPEHVPAGVRVEPVEGEDGERHPRMVGGKLLTLLYSVQIGCVSVDPWHSRVGSLDSADYAFLDLDPGPRAKFSRVVEVAKRVRDELDNLGLHSALKTSGATGIHIAVPLPTKTTYDTALLLAQLIATRVATSSPRYATVERAVSARSTGAIYVDYLQNVRGKSIAGAYAVRARKGATVSTPLRWEELNSGLDPRDFTIATLPARLTEVGDLWNEAISRKNPTAVIRKAADL